MCQHHSLANGPGDLDLSPFDLETGVRVASEVGDLHSEFGHARLSGSGVIRYVRDGRTDRQTDRQKQRLPALFLRAGDNNVKSHVFEFKKKRQKNVKNEKVMT